MLPALGDRRIILSLCLALVAFAANSILCREALLHTKLDALSFTLIRLCSGAVTLWLLVRSTAKPASSEAEPRGRQLLDALWLALYALPFSLAYRRLETGTGALILFGSVQLTMLVAAVLSGERPSAREWLGLLGAFGGLVYLVSPGVHAPNPVGAGEMAVAGMGWGFYTLSGRSAHGTPIRRNARSFLFATLLLAPGLLVGSRSLDGRGIGLALASGMGASALGYVLWYAALRGLTTTRAALSQLSVPALAAFGGVLLLGERVTARLTIASVVVLGALAFAVLEKGKKS
jgi:drug/metabolite transporter (DMT)-like permease